MKSITYLIIILSFGLAGCGATHPAPQGGAAVIVQKPIWLSGIADPVNESFTTEYPAAAGSTHMEVINAGVWLANAYGKRSQLIYELSINVKDLPDQRHYTRMILENPQDQTTPFTYEHYLDPEEKSTTGRHGPLHGVQLGGEYTLVFEIYADQERTQLIDHIRQRMISPADNQSGCVELEGEYKKRHFGALPDRKGKLVPLDKVVIFCER